MSRIRSDSIWNRLAPERRRLFEHWLFEERVSYDEALARAKKEWGVTASKMSVSRYYRRREVERPVNGFAELLETEDAVNGGCVKVDALKKTVMTATTMRFLENAIHHGTTKHLAALSQVVREHEGREIARGRLELARERHQFNAAKEAWKQGASDGPKIPQNGARDNAL